MHAAAFLVVACGGFLLAVLWMDLMFDVQVLRHRQAAELPEPVLASIAAYYRRVTTDARPMGHLVGVIMLLALGLLIAQLVMDPARRWAAAASLPFCAGPVLLALLRVVPAAVRLGSRAGTLSQQRDLARSICRDHLICFGGILAFILLQAFVQ